MVRSLKILIEYTLSVARVFLVFIVALFLPWAFLYQVQTYVSDGKTMMRIAHNDRSAKKQPMASTTEQTVHS
jgi:hypothetical protein